MAATSMQAHGTLLERCTAAGIAVPAGVPLGWTPLLAGLLRDLDGVVVTRIRAGGGLLAVDADLDGYDEPTRTAIRGRVAAAANAASATCELCGADGSLVVRRHAAAVRCPRHRLHG